jgi:hypothetical protein
MSNERIPFGVKSEAGCIPAIRLSKGPEDAHCCSSNECKDREIEGLFRAEDAGEFIMGKETGRIIGCLECLLKGDVM